MTELLLPILGLSLAGSLHCVGMCGPFVAFYSAGDPSTGTRRALPHLSYSAGRLVGYATLGAVAGSLGAALDAVAGYSGFGEVAAVLAGAIMVLWGLVVLLHALGVNTSKLHLEVIPPALQQKVNRFIANLRGRPPLVRAGLLGLASALLPCGFLWIFAITAAGTGGAIQGALVMAVFWAGTVPALFGLGLGVQALAHFMRRHIPVITALILIGMGSWGIFGRLQIESLAHQKFESKAANATQQAAPAPMEHGCH